MIGFVIWAGQKKVLQIPRTQKNFLEDTQSGIHCPLLVSGQVPHGLEIGQWPYL
jgi:hypothetical protein